MSQPVMMANGSRRRAASVIALVGGFVICAFGQLRLANVPGWQDTEAYLGLGLYVAEHGGVPGFLSASFAGTFPITERHPLYLLLLWPFASRTADYFWNAKLVDLAFGAISLITLLWMVRRRFGPGQALIAGTLFALSQSLLVASSHVNHETQFTLCCLWVWWFLTKEGATVKDWALAGVWMGLAYLTKSPAILIGVAVLLSAAAWLVFSRTGSGAGQTRPFASAAGLAARAAVFVLCAAALSTPLLVRNWRGFGTPIYEGVNSNILWLDRWSQLGGEHSVMHYDKYGIKTIERNGLPTAADYLRAHSPTEIAARFLKGLVTETLVVARKAVSPAFPLPKPVSVAWGLLVLALSFAGWWANRRTWPGVLAALCTAAFIAFFGWNKLFPEFRYLAPLVPVWLAFASTALWRLIESRLSAQRALRASTLSCALLMASAAGWTAASGALTRPVPVLGHWAWLRGLVDWKTFRRWEKHPNVLERDYQLKRAMGFPDDVFTRINGLLRR
jgi:hypothetical protein